MNRGKFCEVLSLQEGQSTVLLLTRLVKLENFMSTPLQLKPKDFILSVSVSTGEVGTNSFGGNQELMLKVLSEPKMLM
jgi:hypothetical protein